MAKKEVAKPSVTSLFPTELPESARGTGRGNENVGGDKARPTIKLLQQLSPQLNAGNAAFIEGAEVGQFYNTVSGQTYDELYVSNLYYYKNWAVFKNQKFGGGFEGNFLTRGEAEAHLVAEQLPINQYDLVETAHHIIALIDTETGKIEPAEFMMASTKMPLSNTWNANIASAGGDRFSSIWKMSSAMVTKGQNTWSQVVIDHVGFTPEDLHAVCAESYDNVLAAFTAKAA